MPLHIDEAGEGEPVVLIPGLAGLAKFWHPLQFALAARFHTLALDHPGMGRSPAHGPQSIDAIAQAVLDALDDRGISQAHVIGHSTGGLAAQALALDAPRRVRKLVLSSTWATPDQRFRDLFHLRRHVLLKAGPAAYAALGNLLAYPVDWYEQHIAEPSPIDFDASARSRVQLTVERIDMLLAYQRADALGQVNVSTLVVGARDDGIVPFHHSEALAQLVPGAQLLSLDGGHFAPTTRTEAFAQAVSSFLSPLP